MIIISYIGMADVMPTHYRENEGDEPPKHPPTLPTDCESAPPPKRRQHSKSLIVFQLYNKLKAISSSSLIWKEKYFMLLANILSTMIGILVHSYGNRFHCVTGLGSLYQMSYEYLSSHRSG